MGLIRTRRKMETRLTRKEVFTVEEVNEYGVGKICRFEFKVEG